MAGNSSNKTLKIPTLQFEPVILTDQRRRRPPIDGDDSDYFRCGVCFSDSGKTALRGTIDCCNHTFCFVCIVMWANTKSFCPTCKLNFTTIYGPPKNVVFASKRLVSIPRHNQDYHVFSNSTSLNSYEEITCTMCHGRADESHRRLLCDICDSAVHTYCVGFGPVVPGTSYFCYVCAVSRRSNHAAVDNQKTSRNFNVKLPSQMAIVPVFGNNNPSFSSRSSQLSPLFLTGRRTVDAAYGQVERWDSLSAPLCGKRNDQGHTKARVTELEKLVQSLQQQIEDERRKRELIERGIQERIEQRVEEKLQHHFYQYFPMHKPQKLLKMHSTVFSSQPSA